MHVNNQTREKAHSMAFNYNDASNLGLLMPKNKNKLGSNNRVNNVLSSD